MINIIKIKKKTFFEKQIWKTNCLLKLSLHLRYEATYNTTMRAYFGLYDW